VGQDFEHQSQRNVLTVVCRAYLRSRRLCNHYIFVNGTRIFSTGATAYSCSKAAQVAFAKMVAFELAKHRIRVNVICPGQSRQILTKAPSGDLEHIQEPVEFLKERSVDRRQQARHVGAGGTIRLFLASDASAILVARRCIDDGVAA